MSKTPTSNSNNSPNTTNALNSDDFPGVWNQTSVICSSPSYTGWNSSSFTISKNNQLLTINPTINIGFSGIQTNNFANITSELIATMSSDPLDCNHDFAGGTFQLTSDTTLTLTYTFIMLYNGCTQVLSTNNYTATYKK